MNLFVKIVVKLREEGLKRLLIGVAGKFQRIWRRKQFLKRQKLKLPKYHFSAMSINEFDLSGYPAAEIYSQIEANQYQILEGCVRDWGRSNVPGELQWHKDLVNDYTWSVDVLGVHLPIPFNSGDIKRPWELGRLHQLVQLALCFRALKGTEDKNKCFDLAGKILTDFSKMNPEFYGPQWMCAMDVGIRLANICLASSVFGSEFSSHHQQILDKELSRHIFFIEHNLENSWGTTVANHYLADLSGLVFGYGFCSDKAGLRRLKFTGRRLEKEILRQFGEDGGNFEGSTYYHRLSSELALFALQILWIKNDGKEFRDQRLLSRLAKMETFSKALSRQDGFVPQIGDNDSGHLFIFDPIQFQENDLNQEAIINVFERVGKWRSGDGFEGLIVAALSKCTQSQLSSEADFGEESVFQAAKESLAAKPKSQLYQMPIRETSFEQLSYHSFPEFGVYVCKGPEFHFYIRCGVHPLDVGGGHRHRDQLSLGVFDGVERVGRDPGTYVYTSDVEMRTKMRSSLAHNGPYLNPIKNEKSVFEMLDQQAECFYFGRRGFYGVTKQDGKSFYRLVSFESSCLHIADWVDSGEQTMRIDFKENYFSKCYGSIEVRS